MEIDREPYRDWFSSQVRAASTGYRGGRPTEPRSTSPGAWLLSRPGAVLPFPGAASILPLGGPELGRRGWLGASGGTSGKSGQGGETWGRLGLVERRGVPLCFCSQPLNPLLPTAGSHLQRGAVLLQRLVQRAPQLPDRAPVSAGAGGGGVAVGGGRTVGARCQQPHLAEGSRWGLPLSVFPPTTLD